MRYVIPKNLNENIKLRRRLIWDGSHNRMAAEKIVEACRNDILFYINLFCFTYDPRKQQSKIPFITYSYQDKAILAIQSAIREGNDVAIQKSRDMGASWVMLSVFEHAFHFEEMKSFLMASRNEDLVDASGDPDSLFWKIDFIHECQPKWLMPHELVRTSMHMANRDTGSVIDGTSATGDIGRGGRRTAALIDEFAAFEVGSGYNVLKATRDMTNCRVFNSTPKGSGNAFYDVIHKTAAVTVVTMHWSEHPEKARGLYSSHRDETTGKMVLDLLSDWKGVVKVGVRGENTVKSVVFPSDYPFILDGKKRSPWYDLQCSRAVSPSEIGQELDIDFLGSDYQFFDPVTIEAYKQKWCIDPEAVGDMEMILSTDRGFLFTPNLKGFSRWFEPFPSDGHVDPERRFVLGADISAGTGASNSTAVVYDRKTNEKVFEYANPNIKPDDFARYCAQLARFFNDALIVPDRSGPTGETFVLRLIAEGYGNIYYHRDTKKVGSPISDKPGVFLNPQLRSTILHQYRDSIGHASIINRSELAIEECLCFIVKMDGSIEHSASANATDPSNARANHGDRVIADALADLGLRDFQEIPKAEEQQTPEGTMAKRFEEFKLKMKEPEDELGEGWD